MLWAFASALLLAVPRPPVRHAPAFVAVLDPGHGGDRDGAISADGAREKDLTLEIALRLKKRLEKAGARVVLTRDGDGAVALPQRAALANAEKADVFVSIHLNAMPGPARRKARGVETYFLSADATDASATAVAARETRTASPGSRRRTRPMRWLASSRTWRTRRT